MRLRSEDWLLIIAPRKLSIQPRLGHIPIADDAYWRKLQNFCSLCDAEPAKEAQFHDGGLSWVDFRQRMQCVIDGDKLRGPIHSDIGHLVQRNALEPATPLQVVAPCIVHQ